jgi:hypothetical protein
MIGFLQQRISMVPHMARNTEWTPEDVNQLRTMTAEGLPIPEIGRRLGRSQTSVAQQIHAEGLPLIFGPQRYRDTRKS